MDLSIIIVNYNVKHFLEQCLFSVLKSIKTLRVEIIVVDNHSFDGSSQLLRDKFPEVRLIANTKNVGFAKANNQAIKIAKGRYILLLNPDTVVEENTLEKCIGFMDSHEDAGSLGVKMIDGKGKFLPESKRALPTPKVAFYKTFGLAKLFPKSKTFAKYHLSYLDKNKIHEVDVLSGAFLLIRKTVLDKTGLLDETFFMYGEDIDISYRIQKAGYKNYYFPETTIIHYKGESTKKGSLNYVLVFYNAMIIFAKKHFSNTGLFILLIRLAIYLRAGISIIRRFIINSILPILDILFIYMGYYFFLPIWENYIFNNNGEYPEVFILFIVPSYILTWVISIFYSGGYEKRIKILNIIKGIIFASLIILVIYALLPVSFRFSRALIILGTFWTMIVTIFNRFIISGLFNETFKFIIRKESKNIVIIGEKKEGERVYSILKQSAIKPNLIGFINPEKEINNPEYIGNINQLAEIVKYNKADEIIFCSKNTSTKKIIQIMLSFTGPGVDYKIAPPEGISIIGSNSINTAGDLYILDFNSITKNLNKRKKRLLDIIVSILLLLMFPIMIFIVKNFFRYIKNSFLVLIGRYTWVGFILPVDSSANQPLSKPGILSPVDGLRKKSTNPQLTEKINIVYAKDYKITNDISILLQALKNIDRKINT